LDFSAALSIIAATAVGRDTEEFLSDLFGAKLEYVTTRPYWNGPRAKPKLCS